MNGADKDDALVVTITRNRIYYFGSEQISIEALPMKIQDGIAHGAERKIYIRADARAKYKDIKAVVDAIHQSGIENVGFLVDPRLSEQQKASSRFRGPHY